MKNFDIISKLGDGSYSVVYKVRRKIDGNIYALKKVKLKNLNDKEKENSLNEVRILASVKSTFVISYKEAFIDSDENLCLIMEYADKGDLYQKITQFKKMGCLIEEEDIWKIFIQMAKGLKALHDLKILHRDLKSANIFLFNDGSAKIGDLNVSKVAHKGLGYTQTGTPYYASPEVWKDQPYDSKSDIWSLGCVTYEMLTLHPPFQAKDMDGLYNKVIKGQFNKICGKYSSDICELINLLLKVNPNERLSCSQILKHPIVKKRIEFFQAQSGSDNCDFENMDEAVLLKTIRIPKNILFLSDNLPQANYGQKRNFTKIVIDDTINSKKTPTSHTLLPDIKKTINNSSRNENKEEEKGSIRCKSNARNIKNSVLPSNNAKSSENEEQINNIKISTKRKNESNVEHNEINNNLCALKHKKFEPIKKNKFIENKQYLDNFLLGDGSGLYIPQINILENNKGKFVVKYNKQLPSIYNNIKKQKSVGSSNLPTKKINLNYRLFKE